MAENVQMINRFLHLDGKSDFVLNEARNQIISVGSSDYSLKFFNLGENQISKTLDLDVETSSISIQQDEIIIGDEKGSVQKYLVEELQEFSSLKSADGFQINEIFKLDSEIIQVEHDDRGQYLAAADLQQVVLISKKDNNIYCTSKDIISFESSSEKISNINFQPQNQFLIVSTNIGKLHILYINSTETSVQLEYIKTYYLTQDQSNYQDQKQLFKAKWHPSGQIIVCPGKKHLQMIVKEDSDLNFSEIVDVDSISHDKDISIICWQNNDRLITVGLDNQIKIWDFVEKQMISNHITEFIVQEIKFSQKYHTLYYLDFDGKLNVWKEDKVFNPNFEKLQLLQQQSDQKQKRKNKVNIDLDEEHVVQAEQIQSEDQQQEQDTTQISAQKKKEEVQQQIHEKLDIQNMSINEDKKQKQESVQKENSSQQQEVVVEKQIIREKVIQSRSDQIITCNPQQILFSSSTDFFNQRRFLCWNLYGAVSVRQENSEFSYIDIEFADKNFHKNLIIHNLKNYQMAKMNSKGVIMASQKTMVNEDEYEDDSKEISKYSYIYFKGFTYHYEKCEWEIPMPDGENIESICIGSEFCAVCTDQNYLRIFNFAGLQISGISFDKPLVCMAAYKNLFVYVFHDSPPIFGCQSLKMRLINISASGQNSQINEIFVPISPYTDLLYFDFSSEGLLLSKDSKGVIRGLQMNNFEWVPLKRSEKLWLIGMFNYELIGVNLDKDEIYPKVYPRPQTKQILPDFPCLIGDEKIKEIFMKKFILQHERFRTKNWLSWKFSKEVNEPIYRDCQQILEEDQLMKKEEEIEKELIKLFNKFLISNEYERALVLAETQIQMSKSLQFCNQICNKQNLGQIAAKINLILNERVRQEQFSQQFQPVDNQIQSNRANNVANNNSAHPIVIEDQPQKQKSFGISHFGIQQSKVQPLTLEQIKKDLDTQNEKKAKYLKEKYSNTKTNASASTKIINEEEDNQEDMKENNNNQNIQQDQSLNNPFSLKTQQQNNQQNKNLFDQLAKPQINPKKRLDVPTEDSQNNLEIKKIKQQQFKF